MVTGAENGNDRLSANIQSKNLTSFCTNSLGKDMHLSRPLHLWIKYCNRLGSLTFVQQPFWNHKSEFKTVKKRTRGKQFTIFPKNRHRNVSILQILQKRKIWTAISIKIFYQENRKVLLLLLFFPVLREFPS